MSYSLISRLFFLFSHWSANEIAKTIACTLQSTGRRSERIGKWAWGECGDRGIGKEGRREEGKEGVNSMNKLSIHIREHGVCHILRYMYDTCIRGHA